MLEEKDDSQSEEQANEVSVESSQIEKEVVVSSDASDTTKEEANKSTDTKETDQAVNELEDTVAEDAEDEEVVKRHEITVLDYHSMSMEELVKELAKLIRTEKVQAIKEHVDGIKTEFNLKFDELLEQKKEEFLAEGGNIIDFSYSNPTKSAFSEIYFDYKEKRNSYYKTLEQNLKVNLKKRLEIIEELKGLINVEENINDTYKHFKELQESWRNAGSIPRMEYNNTWRTYHHHVERFYDFLHLNRELRDLDFKHNLEEKLKIISRAEELAKEADSNRAFRELQSLHKLWKEEIGPVAKEYREDIWERFSKATKSIHDNRQEYLKNIDSIYEDNLVKKVGIIEKIQGLADQKITNHSIWQKTIKEIESLREQFFKAGKVPSKVNEDTWTAFKSAVRDFNRSKNAFYKGLKKEQQDNLHKKMELVKIAEANKENDDWAVVTPLMKKIQNDWKKIGHVPRKHSDRIWGEFKSACNHYFDRLHASKNKANDQEITNLETKKQFIEDLKKLKTSGDVETDKQTLIDQIEAWKAIGRVPYNKRNIEDSFNKTLDELFKAFNLDKTEGELLKYSNKLSALSNHEDSRKLDNERMYIRKKIDDVKGEIRQLENNLQFFSNASESSPLVQDVYANIEKHKDSLEVLKAKLQQIRSL
jgi:hypothetical protein